MGFTLKIYKEMLTALQTQDFSFQTFSTYTEAKAKAKGTAPHPGLKPQPVVLLRHDVDLLPGNSLTIVPPVFLSGYWLAAGS